MARQYVDFSVRTTGPVFNRIFNPPEGQEGHEVQARHPALGHDAERQRTSTCSTAIVKLESGDYVVGRTQVTYDLTNRLYAKKDVAREILSLSVNQTYYTDARAAQYDLQYQSSFTVQQKDSNFSPVALQFRASPTDRLQGGLPDRVGPDAHALTQHRGERHFSSGDWLNGSAGWSQRRFIPDFPGFDDPNLRRPVHQLRPSTSARFAQQDRRQLPFNYDVLHDRFLNQRWVAYYNAQCCGVGIRVPDLQPAGLAGAHRRCPRIAASTSRSRWPESARSPTCSARSAGSRAADPPSPRLRRASRTAAAPCSARLRPVRRSLGEGGTGAFMERLWRPHA